MEQKFRLCLKCPNISFALQTKKQKIIFIYILFFNKIFMFLVILKIIQFKVTSTSLCQDALSWNINIHMRRS